MCKSVTVRVMSETQQYAVPVGNWPIVPTEMHSLVKANIGRFQPELCSILDKLLSTDNEPETGVGLGATTDTGCYVTYHIHYDS